MRNNQLTTSKGISRDQMRQCLQKTLSTLKCWPPLEKSGSAIIDFRNHVPFSFTNSKEKLCLCQQPTVPDRSLWRATCVDIGKTRSQSKAWLALRGHAKWEAHVKIWKTKSGKDMKLENWNQRGGPGFSKAQPRIGWTAVWEPIRCPPWSVPPFEEDSGASTELRYALRYAVPGAGEIVLNKTPWSQGS